MYPNFVTVFGLFVFYIVSEAVLFETTCEHDHDCDGFQRSEVNVNATCINQNCICKDNEMKIVECLPNKDSLANQIGNKCPCSRIKWSACINGFCMCMSDFLASHDMRRCLPKKVPIGNECEFNAQCTRQSIFAHCKNGMCSCKPRFIAHNGTCQSLVGLGEECDAHEKCQIIPHTLCTSKQCICEPGFVAKFDKSSCLPNADYSDGCLESAQCQQKLGVGAVCERSKCVCDEDYVNVTTLIVTNVTKTFCENQAAIGDMCSYDTDCIQSRTEMKCFLSKCQCEFGYEPDRDLRYCVKSGCHYNSLNSLMAIVCLVISFNYLLLL